MGKVNPIQGGIAVKPESNQSTQPEAKQQQRSLLPQDPRPENHSPERQRGLDKTIEDSYPASDPPSSIPNPRLELEEDQAA
jgi:hypothetical protein